MKRRNPAIQCEQEVEYGCPGGPAGDEFAPVVFVICPAPATHVTKSVDPYPYPGVPTRSKMRVCGFHGRKIQELYRDPVYRFRTV